jgi:hypothetical protein
MIGDPPAAPRSGTCSMPPRSSATWRRSASSSSASSTSPRSDPGGDGQQPRLARQALLIEYLRDVGKHFTVPYMLAKDLGSLDRGLSFTEFAT